MQGGYTVTGVTPGSGLQAYTIGTWTQITTAVIAASGGGAGMLYTDGTFLATNVEQSVPALATAIMARRVVYTDNYLGFVPLPAFNASRPLKGHIADLMVFFDAFTDETWGGAIYSGSLFCTSASQQVQETEAPTVVEDTPAPSALAGNEPGVCSGLLTHRYKATSALLVNNVASVADSGVVFPRVPMTLSTHGSGGFDIVQNALLLGNAMNATLNTSSYGTLGQSSGSGFAIRLVVRVDELPVRCAASAICRGRPCRLLYRVHRQCVVCTDSRVAALMLCLFAPTAWRAGPCRFCRCRHPQRARRCPSMPWVTCTASHPRSTATRTPPPSK
jgi:hypothetical protein